MMMTVEEIAARLNGQMPAVQAFVFPHSNMISLRNGDETDQFMLWQLSPTPDTLHNAIYQGQW